jgi:hypothetical protein
MKHPFEYLRPSLVLAFGGISFVISLILSLTTGAWHWFPRGGAVLALAGFIISVREALLYRPFRPRKWIPEGDIGVGLEGLFRTGPFGGLVPNPDLFPYNPDDPDITQAEIDEERRKQREAWDDAEEPEKMIETDPGEKGRPMRDSSQMTPEELRLIRIAAIFGIVGTFIWAFGDLIGGLPTHQQP